ncbi:PI-PLC X domain-containing protein 3 isoform X1 [Mastacembelus armatus]|uniref:Phosphatidylinositol-specific phospholipase C, X domain containing 3 n=1 Tax=Mastacembelus armatus TaxID=205130 RepID=A0A7N8WID1_9TELE|nr:PI-PLC X domain-containing protein 3 isoform X1 [Mastacembelus armatus]
MCRLLLRGVWTGSRLAGVFACVSLMCVKRKSERESAHSRLAQGPVRENGALCTAAAWLRLTGEATCGSLTGWQVYRRACTPSRSPTWRFPVREGLEQISSFLSAHAREVVFLDFNHFYGVQNLHHEKLVAMLKEVFGEKLCPVVFAQEVTLQYLWEKEYQVLVFYHHPMALEVPFLWPGQMMPSPWANTTDPEKLVQFLQASITDRRRKGTFFVSQVVLTPKASTVMKGVASGLRETITERALPGMMQWIRSQRPGESGINIITADFVELGEFISAVITLNYHLDEDDDDAT